MSTNDADEASLALSLRNLEAEREQIKALTHPGLQAGLKRLRDNRAARLQVVHDARKHRVADARARHEVEKRLYHSEYDAAKCTLRTQVLVSATAVRLAPKAKHRFVPRRGSLAITGITKTPHATSTPMRTAANVMKFVRNLEKDGLIRLALAPDVITADLAAVRKANAENEAGNGRGNAHGDINANININSNSNANGNVNGNGNGNINSNINSNNNNNSNANRTTEKRFIPGTLHETKIHTARGILTAQGQNFEKGHIVAIYANKAGSLPKYHGEISAISRKEIHIRVSEAVNQVVKVSALKSLKFLIKRDRDGSTLRNKRL